jgi:hypothetical protein
MRAFSIAFLPVVVQGSNGGKSGGGLVFGGQFTGNLEGHSSRARGRVRGNKGKAILSESTQGIWPTEGAGQENESKSI